MNTRNRLEYHEAKAVRDQAERKYLRAWSAFRQSLTTLDQAEAILAQARRKLKKEDTR